MKNLGILGGGFGLYGYLPAGIKYGYNILTLKKYEKRISQRSDLKNLITKIKFLDNENDLLSQSDLIAVAKRPVDQNKIVYKLPALLPIILEKPLSSHTNTSLKIINHLKKNKNSFRIGFTFLETEWYKNFKKFYFSNYKRIISIDIKWLFKAFHYKSKINTWKKFVSSDGGAFHFYGSHFIAMLADIDSWNINKFNSYRIGNDEEYKFFLSASKNQIDMNILCDSKSVSNIFEISIKTSSTEKFILKMNNPFTIINSLEDSRIRYLINIINSLMLPNNHYYRIYDKYIDILLDCDKKKQILKNK